MTPVPSIVRRQWTKHQSRVELVIRYLTGQGTLQALNVLNGFFLLRWLSIDEQAKFSVAMALQATLGLLGDLGFGGSLVGLIGNQTDDRELIGQYIRGIQHFKNRFLIGSVILGSCLAFIYYQRHEWNYDFVVIFILVLVSIYAQSQSGYYAALLQIKRNLAALYRPQIISASVRLLVSALLFSWAGLNALLVIFLTTLVFAVNAYWMKRQASVYYIPAPKTLSANRSRIWKTLLPVAPLVFFYATQGQITTFLISYFGKKQGIAEIGALGRLGQLFALLGPFNTVVIMPYFARSIPEQLFKRFTSAILAGAILVIPICLVGWLSPNIYLALLGPKYVSVRSNLVLYLCSVSLSYIGSLIWAINVSRNWNYWYTTTFNILSTVLIQIYFIMWIDLSMPHQVIKLSFTVALVALFNSMLASLVGFTRTVS